jgi:hypothetical protein
MNFYTSTFKNSLEKDLIKLWNFGNKISDRSFQSQQQQLNEKIKFWKCQRTWSQYITKQIGGFNMSREKEKRNKISNKIRHLLLVRWNRYKSFNPLTSDQIISYWSERSLRMNIWRWIGQGSIKGPKFVEKLLSKNIKLHWISLKNAIENFKTKTEQKSNLTLLQHQTCVHALNFPPQLSKTPWKKTEKS